ncbi:MAG: glycosyltransferase family 2 protein [Lachnobacterium sp.]|nr:glycosyltransferase family 2 protein [Lachnobacterium sp.]MCI7087039.1 glycosyltransferase family 2 protein [Lachnobacterium sp.]
MSKISIVVPMYNEQESLGILYKELNRVTDTLPEYEFEYLFVNDGSSDATLAEIRQLAEKDKRVRYVSFSRNFGKEAALYAGLKNATGDYVATMDADLQDPPALLPQMIAMIEAGDCDNVATRRVNRKGEPPIRSFFAKCFYKVMRHLSHIEIADGARDYRLMSRAMVDSIVSVSEYNRFSKGIFAWVGYETKWLEFENVERSAGETKWSFWKLVRYSFDGIINFSDTPIRISSYLGLLLTVLSFVAIIIEVIRALVFGDPVAGWPSLVCIITFIGGIQLFCMGIMGQYIAKTYMEVKRRPHYIVKETNCCGNVTSDPPCTTEKSDCQ